MKDTGGSRYGVTTNGVKVICGQGLGPTPRPKEDSSSISMSPSNPYRMTSSATSSAPLASFRPSEREGAVPSRIRLCGGDSTRSTLEQEAYGENDSCNAELFLPKTSSDQGLPLRKKEELPDDCYLEKRVPSKRASCHTDGHVRWLRRS